MFYTPSFRDDLHADIQPSYLSHALTEEEIDSRKFGLPRFKKYPMPDAAHVKSAIKFFNYVTPANEAELARNILARMDEYGIDPESINVGDNNRFKKYLERSTLKHHGIKGMKWGVRRYQNPDGSLNAAGKKRYDASQKRFNKLADRGDKLRAKGKTRSFSSYNQHAINASVMRERSKKLEETRKKNDALLRKQKLAAKKAREDRDNAFRKVYGENEKIDYMKIYTEMSREKRFKNLLNSEDPDDYRAAELAWRKKHNV